MQVMHHAAGCALSWKAEPPVVLVSKKPFQAMKNTPSGSSSRFSFVTLTVDGRRFDSAELATEAGKRQFRELLDFLREKSAKIHRAMTEEGCAVKHWHVLLSSDRPISGGDIEATWGLGRINVLNWIERRHALQFMRKGRA